MNYTADALIPTVRRFAQLGPSAESTQTANLLSAMNDEQRLYLATLLQKAKGQHRQSTLELTADGSKTRFDIPARAIAAGLKMVERVDAAGNASMLYEFPDEAHARGNPSNGVLYFEGNQLVFYAAPVAGLLRVTYSRRLSELVLVASVRPITGINTGTKTVTIAAAPSGFTGLTAMDLVRATPHFDLLAMDAACTNIGSLATSVVFSSALPTGLAVGDYVCVPGESPVCQAPLELHSVLALRTAFVWSVGKNDSVANRVEGLLKEARANASVLLEPREGAEAAMSNPNGPGWSGRYGRGARTSGVLP